MLNDSSNLNRSDNPNREVFFCNFLAKKCLKLRGFIGSRRLEQIRLGMDSRQTKLCEKKLGFIAQQQNPVPSTTYHS